MNTLTQFGGLSEDAPMFTKILIANRGEIACRIIRSCRDLGVRTVAVYSEADAKAPHVMLADEAHCIGPSASSESYLVGEKILEVAKKTGAEAIHPGYGFLSENASFRRACEASGIGFVGPSADAMIAMGEKTLARETMSKAGVPIVPGTDALEDDEVLEAGRKLGFPIMIKAAAGGGGKGMRVVHDENELVDAFQGLAEQRAAHLTMSECTLSALSSDHDTSKFRSCWTSSAMEFISSSENVQCSVDTRR